jgi:hypothetical protein
MRVIIAGSRNITDYSIVYEAIKESHWSQDIETLVTGGAKGVDALGEQWARDHIGQENIDRYNANWKKYGKQAGYKRNQEMAMVADALIAVWDMKSTGTAHMIEIANEFDLEVFIWRVR